MIEPSPLMETLFWLLWAALRAVLTGAALWLAALAADLFILPVFPPGRWKRPICLLFDHASDERDADDDEPGDTCQRCGGMLPPRS